jgi:hypothetical protein
MVTALTVKCDWRGCKATVTVPLAHDALQHVGWRQENYGLFALHLCRHSWFAVRQQTAQQPAPSTP